MEKEFRQGKSLFINLLITVGIILSIGMGVFSYFSINYFKKHILNNVMTEADRFSNTILLGTHYAMMSNVRDDIMQIIGNIARQQDIKSIRIYHKEGQIKFSNNAAEIDTQVNINDYACAICHKFESPPVSLKLKDRARFLTSADGKRSLGIVNPIYNEPQCSSADCHAHSPESTILGALDVVLSLDKVDSEIRYLEIIYFTLSILVFLITSTLIFLYLIRFVSRPVNKLIQGTQLIAQGEFFNPVLINRDDEMGRLAVAISHMGEEIAKQQAELIQTNDDLFEANRELEMLSTTDELTGLYNRRHLLRIFRSEFERAIRYGHHLSILLIDVDHFKDVNDQYGHLCGDRALTEIAGVLKRIVRRTDLVARYGGEEMVVVLLETDCEKAINIAEKVRKEVASQKITYEDICLLLTISIGVASYPNVKVKEPMQLLEAADQALYKAKNTGRNKVVCHMPD